MIDYLILLFPVPYFLPSGYIFPLMLAGSSFGRAIYYILPESVPVQVAVLCTAAGMNVAITRTAMASTLILAFLPGEPCAIPAILMASICSLFATSYMVRSFFDDDIRQSSQSVKNLLTHICS